MASLASPEAVLPGRLRSRGPAYPFLSDGRQLYLVTGAGMVRVRRLTTSERKRLRNALREARQGSR